MNDALVLHEIAKLTHRPIIANLGMAAGKYRRFDRNGMLWQHHYLVSLVNVFACNDNI